MRELSRSLAWEQVSDGRSLVLPEQMVEPAGLIWSLTAAQKRIVLTVVLEKTEIEQRR